MKPILRLVKAINQFRIYYEKLKLRRCINYFSIFEPHEDSPAAVIEHEGFPTQTITVKPNRPVGTQKLAQKPLQLLEALALLSIWLTLSGLQVILLALLGFKKREIEP